MLTQLFRSGHLETSTFVYSVLVKCTVDISSTFGNGLRSLVDIPKTYTKLTCK